MNTQEKNGEENKIDYSDDSIVIATHVFTTGPAQDLQKYLIDKKAKDLLFIGHPLFYSPKLKGSSYIKYRHGEIVKTLQTKNIKYPFLFSYVFDVIKTIIFVISTRKKYELFVGSNCLNALAGVVLQKMGVVKKTVFYVIDYDPQRFQSRSLNYIYHLIDHLCVKYCDVTWNLSPRMQEGRKKYFGIPVGKQITVPLGIWFDRIPRHGANEIDRFTLVFMGHILEKQGVQFVLQAIPEIITHIPEFRFKVVGGGEYLEALKQQAKQLGIEKYIDFTGSIPADAHDELEKIVAKCAVAIAPYPTYIGESKTVSFTYYADPAKIKVYLGCGLPVLLTDISYNATEIQNRECGKIITTDPKNIAKNVVEVLGDFDTLSRYKENAIKYSQGLNWENVFSTFLGKIL